MLPPHRVAGEKQEQQKSDAASGAVPLHREHRGRLAERTEAEMRDRVLLAALMVAMAMSSPCPAQEPGRKVEEGYLTTPDGVRLFYQRVGNGPQTVLQPGRLFAFEELRWLGEHFTLISYDMRNRGRSDLVLDEAKITFEQDVADMETVRRHFGVERMALLGYSYLGKIVVLYALE